MIKQLSKIEEGILSYKASITLITKSDKKITKKKKKENYKPNVPQEQIQISLANY